MNEPMTDEDGSGPAQVAQLRARIVALEAELAVAATTNGASGLSGLSHSEQSADRVGPRSGRWRPIVASTLIIATALLAVATVVARWAHDQVSDTDRYVATVAPLAQDPAVQNAITQRIVTEIFNRIDVQALTQQTVAALAAQGVPPRVVTTLDALEAPVVSGIHGFVEDKVQALVQSAAFQKAWVQANRGAHEQLVAVLTGKGSDAVAVNGNKVQLNLAPLISTVKTRLIQSGFTLAQRIPSVNASFTLFESSDVGKAQNGFALLSTLANWLPLMALLTLALAVYVARNRLNALMAGALAIAVGMLLLGVGLNVARPLYLNAVPSDVLPTDAAAAIYDALVNYLRLALRTVLVVSLAVAIGAWLAGSSASAAGSRRGVIRALDVVRGGTERVGFRSGRVGVFADRHQNGLRGVIVALLVVGYVLADHPTAGWTLRLLGCGVLALLVVEFLARSGDSAVPAR